MSRRSGLLLLSFMVLTPLANARSVTPARAIEEITEQQFHDQFNTNVLGVLLVTQAAVKHLGEGASIINISSGVTRITPPASPKFDSAPELTC